MAARDARPTCDTPITSDVMGDQTDDEGATVLAEIAALPTASIRDWQAEA